MFNYFDENEWYSFKQSDLIPLFIEIIYLISQKNEMMSNFCTQLSQSSDCMLFIKII